MCECVTAPRSQRHACEINRSIRGSSTRPPILRGTATDMMNDRCPCLATVPCHQPNTRAQTPRRCPGLADPFRAAGYQGDKRRPRGTVGPSINRLVRQATYDLAQQRLLHRFGCIFGREPLDVALRFFRPLPALTLHPERKDVHVTHHDGTVLETLLIRKRSEGALSYRAHHSGLFERLPRSRIMGRLAPVWPALRDDPTLRLSRRDKHDLGAGLPVRSIRQGRILNSPRTDGSTRTTHNS